MVISQIAGLATAFGTGELSGAGFGPNYTILMKLGYEFFAPRILEEMEKNPNVFFQDTLWFQKFQKQIKLYSDKVMSETLQTLLTIPQATIDAIDKKFGIGGSDDNILIQNLLSNIKGGNDVLVGIANALSTGITLNVAGIPSAFASPGHGTTGTVPNQPLVPTDIIPGQTPPISDEDPEFQGPPNPPPIILTQKQILELSINYLDYRQKGGLLTKLKWNQAKFGLFPTGNTEITRQINVVIKQTTGKFVKGASSPRRKTQSSNITLSKLNNAVSLSIVNLQRTYKISPIGSSTVHVASFRAFRNLIQSLKNWLFTYR